MLQTANYGFKKRELIDSPPDITLTNSNWDIIDEELKKNADNAVKYAVDTGSANAKVVTLNPALEGYKEGMAIAFKNRLQNTGAITININGLGVKSILKSNGNDLTSGNLKADSIYTIRYNGTSFILQGEGGSGNALASDLLSGKTASTDAGDIIGTMPNRGAGGTVTPSTVNQTKEAGYYSSPIIIIGDMDLIPENIRAGTDIFGVIGTLDWTYVATPGDEVLFTSPTASHTTSSSWTLHHDVEVNFDGLVRVKYATYVSSTDRSGNYQLYKNGVPVGVLRTVSGSSYESYTGYAEDMIVSKGDNIQLYAKGNNNGQPRSKDFKICVAKNPIATVIN
ncbi:hypothetical protein [Psychrobacillus sp. NEAU-3TGS]|uniref:hypothetical protein n=1 Tax=Psychrobacillus sp. NEAU-3TGS TaxID=2995412 RepID=UPI00249AE217|nr:hypothetical protein [Psychrobacillus sp. NEAU-3TGS]